MFNLGLDFLLCDCSAVSVCAQTGVLKKFNQDGSSNLNTILSYVNLML